MKKAYAEIFRASGDCPRVVKFRGAATQAWAVPLCKFSKGFGKEEQCVGGGW